MIILNDRFEKSNRSRYSGVKHVLSLAVKLAHITAGLYSTIYWTVFYIY